MRGGGQEESSQELEGANTGNFIYVYILTRIKAIEVLKMMTKSQELLLQEMNRNDQGIGRQWKQRKMVGPTTYYNEIQI
jgi:hypothetical protein